MVASLPVINTELDSPTLRTIPEPVKFPMVSEKSPNSNTLDELERLTELKSGMTFAAPKRKELVSATTVDPV